MQADHHPNAEKLVKYECANCKEEITLHLKAVLHTKVVICPHCKPVNFKAFG
jgi:DNA-directed RNA polymerase subunit RPC12/RpoP